MLGDLELGRGSGICWGTWNVLGGSRGLLGYLERVEGSGSCLETWERVRRPGTWKRTWNVLGDVERVRRPGTCWVMS
mgnify:FL=1